MTSQRLFISIWSYRNISMSIRSIGLIIILGSILFASFLPIDLHRGIIGIIHASNLSHLLPERLWRWGIVERIMIPVESRETFSKIISCNFSPSSLWGCHANHNIIQIIFEMLSFMLYPAWHLSFSILGMISYSDSMSDIVKPLVSIPLLVLRHISRSTWPSIILSGEAQIWSWRLAKLLIKRRAQYASSITTVLNKFFRKQRILKIMLTRYWSSELSCVTRRILWDGIVSVLPGKSSMISCIALIIVPFSRYIP